MSANLCDFPFSFPQFFLIFFHNLFLFPRFWITLGVLVWLMVVVNGE